LLSLRATLTSLSWTTNPREVHGACVTFSEGMSAEDEPLDARVAERRGVVRLLLTWRSRSIWPARGIAARGVASTRSILPTGASTRIAPW